MNRLLLDLLTKEITIHQFVNSLDGLDTEEMEHSIANALEARLVQKDWIALQKLLIAAIRFPSTRYTSVLCKLLRLKHPELTNEDLVEALEASKDPS